MTRLAVALRELDGYQRLSADVRRELSAPLAEMLGGEFEPLRDLVGAPGFCAVRHRPTKLVFVAIPGGAFDMGLTESDVEEASEYVDWTAGVQQFIARLERVCRPVHKVAVRPFACAVEPVGSKLVKKLSKGRLTSDTFDVTSALSFVAGLGFRLPSEAELEYLAREGRDQHFVNDGARVVHESERWMDWPDTNQWGLRHLTIGEWAADAWHASYEGAPSTSEPWPGADPRGVYRGALPSGPDQSREEILFGLSAFRGEGVGSEDDDDDRRYFMVRLALDLPL